MGISSAQLAQISLIGQIGGGLSSAIGSYYSAASQKTNLQTQAYLADVNARMAERSAQTALDRGQKQVGQLTLKAGQLKSTQRANLAANGVDLGEGNAAEIQASTDILKEVDKNTLETNAVYDAWGFRVQGSNYQNEALMARASASAINPGASAFTSLLGSAGNVAGSWYNYTKTKEDTKIKTKEAK